MTAIDLAKLQATPTANDPFAHLVVPGFLSRAALDDVEADFPAIDKPGSFPLGTLSYGGRFGALMDELRGPALRDVIAEKFAVDLTGRPTTLTVRGQARAKDGRIHTDSKDKIITVLLYLNPGWSDAAGRLRLLRTPDGLDDYAVEVAPEAGTLLAFRNGPTAWHGHQPVEGPRRVIQLNWVTSDRFARRERWRHSLSAFFKRLNPFA